MEARHREITEIALTSVGRYGFALAGGYAVQAHGMGNRLSSDVDLFTDSREQVDFNRAVDEVIAAFAANGYDVTTAIRNDVFARLLLTKHDSTEPDKLEMAVDWRAHPPVATPVGPVLHPDDAVANKMCALFNRAESRDFLDVQAAISSGRYSRETLIELARQADPGFDVHVFATALRSLERITDTDFAEYQVTPERLAALRKDFGDWAHALQKSAA
ncbi:nucleotidyl transferase AbiEii/AbiGii toxin family protein [Catellatospora citrea]|uniref:Nucleotidyltransferase AbiEii toxin of type IV toxin-antitoxin system n=1 Tax=Catellatospora citrea TaxID=53366 RepID=A0A8J3NZL8_9ACTN|nr:nucleotidyl transferase AbiEii/AbiGii toxin family protein [Catellatospora citrea]RKE08107.1 nucleotidyltransferase AbiEii toxin of type IV toxin-antitoxin system [Catellatospora citrea]GIF98488.1 hypothetical protein Cci01nite_35820 [Catellatospora citrea]